jgi:acylphosphatase
VKGRVQGVSFRYATRKKAQELGVCGYARNLDDGSVDVLACGEEEAVTSLCQWLLKGPSFAQVSSVQCVDHALIVENDFTIA